MKKFLFIMAMMFPLFAFIGCSNDNDKELEQAEFYKQAFIGKWRCTHYLRDNGVWIGIHQGFDSPYFYIFGEDNSFETNYVPQDKKTFKVDAFGNFYLDGAPYFFFEFNDDYTQVELTHGNTSGYRLKKIS